VTFAFQAFRNRAPAAAALAAALAVPAVCAAQEKDGTEAAARRKAVDKIMAQIEQVRLAPLMTGRELFERLPKLRSAARELVAGVAAEAPVAPMQPAGYRVDVTLPGDRLLRHLEQASTRIEIPKELRRSLSLRGFANGRVYRARGEVGGVPLPKVWRGVGRRGRNLAAGAARTKALEMALAQIVAAARNQGLPGADRLATVVGDANWVRGNAPRLIRHGARDLKGAQFLDDGTCRVILELPSAALFKTLEEQGTVPGLPGEMRAALKRALQPITGVGRGTAKAPEQADAVERPRVLRAKVTAPPAKGASGKTALTTAYKAARAECLARLQADLYRVRWDERRTVHDYLTERIAAGDTAVRDRLARFMGGAREVQSRAAPGDQWYYELELNLDGLEAALRG
jgi:hypothetical protein